MRWTKTKTQLKTTDGMQWKQYLREHIVNSYIKKEKKSQINKIVFCLKKLEKKTVKQ